MESVVQQIENKYRKQAVVEVRSGDTVRVHQKIKEGSKERVQVFEGMVIRVDRRKSLTYRITVRKIASGIGVEKGFMLHAPNIVKVEVVKRSKVRRNYLSYIRDLTGKSARLSAVDFDSQAVNDIPEEAAPEADNDNDTKEEADKPKEEKAEAAPEAKEEVKSEPAEEKAEAKEADKPAKESEKA